MILLNLKWINNWKINSLLLAGVLILLSILFLYPKLNEKNNKVTEVSPKQVPSYKLNENLGPFSGQSNEVRKQITAKVTKDVGDELVYSADGVRVLYLIRNDIFAVGITQGSFEEKKKLVEDWLKSYGLTPADLCRFGIEFAAGKDIKFPLTEIDMAPTGCKVAVTQQ